MKKKFNVLIIDDAFFIRGLIKKAIGSKRNDDYMFEILAEANDGKEGLDLYKISNPDVVTIDINMPKLNGLELIKEIKSINPNAQIIVISSNIDTKLQKDILNMNVHFIQKPFIENDIWNKLDLIADLIINNNSKSKEIKNITNEVVEKIEDIKETEMKSDLKVEHKEELNIKEDVKTDIEEIIKPNTKLNHDEKSEIVDNKNNNIKSLINVNTEVINNKKAEDNKESLKENSTEVQVQKKKKNKKKKKKNIDIGSDNLLEIGSIPNDMFDKFLDDKKNKNNNQNKNVNKNINKNITKNIDSFITSDTILPVSNNQKVSNKNNEKTTKKENNFFSSIVTDAAIPVKNIVDYKKDLEKNTNENINKKSLLNDNSETLIKNRISKEGYEKSTLIDNTYSKEQPLELKQLDNEELLIIEEPKVASNEEVITEDKKVLVNEKKNKTYDNDIDISIIDNENPIENTSLNINDEDTILIDDEIELSTTDELLVIEEATSNEQSNSDEMILIDNEDENFDNEDILLIEDDSKEIINEKKSINNYNIEDNTEEILSITDDDKSEIINDESIDDYIDDSEFLEINTQNISLDIDEEQILSVNQDKQSLSDIEKELLSSVSYDLDTELNLLEDEDNEDESEDVEDVFNDNETTDELNEKEPILTEEDLRKQKLKELDMVLDNLDSFNFDEGVPLSIESNKGNDFNTYCLNMFKNEELMSETKINTSNNNYHTLNRNDSTPKMELNKGVNNYNTRNSEKAVIAPPKSKELEKFHSETLKQNYGLIITPEKEEVETEKTGGFFTKLFNLFKKKKK